MIDQTVINRLAKRIKDIPPFPEAPKDGKMYLRKNGAWEEVRQDGWIPALETWTRTGDNEFTISGNVTDRYQATDKFKLVQDGNTRYGYFTSVTFSGGNTIITTSLEETLTAHDITEAYYSRIRKPFGFPYTEALVFDGSWNTGSVTIVGSAAVRDFYMELSGQGTLIHVIKRSDNAFARGIGGYSSATPNIITYHFAATVSGEIWTFVACNLQYHAVNSGHTNLANNTVVKIYAKY